MQFYLQMIDSLSFCEFPHRLLNYSQLACDRIRLFCVFVSSVFLFL